MSKVFVVLGMHRSATSLVSKSLCTQIYMGLCPQPNVWESRRIVMLNKRILRRAGGSWHSPPSEAAILEQCDHFDNRIKDLLAIEKGDRELWGWKDPRTALTIKLWAPHLENPHYICIFRNPAEVAKSLRRRDGFPLKKGEELARIYNDRILNFLVTSDTGYFTATKAHS